MPPVRVHSREDEACGGKTAVQRAPRRIREAQSPAPDGHADQGEEASDGGDRRLRAPRLADEAQELVPPGLQRDRQGDVADDQSKEHADEVAVQSHGRIGAEAREHPQPGREDQHDREHAERRDAERGPELFGERPLAGPAAGLGEHQGTDEQHQQGAERGRQPHERPLVARPPRGGVRSMPSVGRVEGLAGDRGDVADDGRGLRWHLRRLGSHRRPGGEDARKEGRQADTNDGEPSRGARVPRGAGACRERHGALCR
jgi:hypothetical protein